MVRRVPMMLGPLIGGWLVTEHGWGRGMQKALLICILLGLATALLQWFMMEPAGSGSSTNQHDNRTSQQMRSTPGAARGSSESPNSRGIGLSGVVQSFTPTLRELLVSDILIRFCERIPYAFVILWAMNHGGLNARQYGLLVAIEILAAMFCYLPVAHLADKYGRRPFVLATFGFFTLFPITLLWAENFLWLAVAFAVRGLKEFGEPARKALIIGEALPELRSRTYGAYYLIRDCTVTTGSFVGAWLWSMSPLANFVGA